jgi:hypothetical protein
VDSWIKINWQMLDVSKKCILLSNQSQVAIIFIIFLIFFWIFKDFFWIFFLIFKEFFLIFFWNYKEIFWIFFEFFWDLADQYAIPICRLLIKVLPNNVSFYRINLSLETSCRGQTSGITFVSDDNATSFKGKLTTFTSLHTSLLVMYWLA